MAKTVGKNKEQSSLMNMLEVYFSSEDIEDTEVMEYMLGRFKKYEKALLFTRNISEHLSVDMNLTGYLSLMTRQSSKVLFRKLESARSAMLKLGYDEIPLSVPSVGVIKNLLGGDAMPFELVELVVKITHDEEEPFIARSAPQRERVLMTMLSLDTGKMLVDGITDVISENIESFQKAYGKNSLVDYFSHVIRENYEHVKDTGNLKSMMNFSTTPSFFSGLLDVNMSTGSVGMMLDMFDAMSSNEQKDLILFDKHTQLDDKVRIAIDFVADASTNSCKIPPALVDRAVIAAFSVVNNVLKTKNQQNIKNIIMSSLERLAESWGEPEMLLGTQVLLDNITIQEPKDFIKYLKMNASTDIPSKVINKIVSHLERVELQKKIKTTSAMSKTLKI